MKYLVYSIKHDKDFTSNATLVNCYNLLSSECLTLLSATIHPNFNLEIKT